MCNRTLDARSSHAYVDGDREVYRAPGKHWEVHSDVGCMRDGISVSAWVVDAIWVINRERHHLTVAFGYETAEGNHSSFSAEVWGTGPFTRYIGRNLEEMHHWLWLTPMGHDRRTRLAKNM